MDGNGNPNRGQENQQPAPWDQTPKHALEHDLDLLNLTIGREGAGRPVTIRNVTLREFENKHGRTSRLLTLVTVTHDGYEFDVTAAHMLDEEGNQVKRALYLDLDAEGHIRADSVLAEFMRFFGVKTPGDLIGQSIMLKPNDKGHLLAVALRDKQAAA